MTAYEEARARFERAVVARDRLEAELALSDMKQAVSELAWQVAAAGAVWQWSP